MTDRETARLSDPEIEDKETRPPPRYREGTLIEAMQNAWRFVEDEALRERLKEAKGIGTPATRAEIIAGLKRQGFLAAQGKNIVPTERGLALFAVLERADPALVDAGVTAELECLLDDVLIGRQKMMGAIDAVCGSAGRIIGRLTEHAVDGERIGAAACAGGDADRPPTSAMRKLVASIAKRKGIKPPAGYTKSAAVCRVFLDEHAPQGDRRPDSSTPTREAKARKSSNGGQARKTSGPKSAKPRRAAKPDGGDAGTPLRIPYGNKEVAFSLGARYGANGWYAPQGVDLTGFRERGWL